ncbi:tRNA lysidine(34) synthetase TilS [Halomonas sp. 1390]|uniref:tRNA lysidine(34) synthetase TilS n=1 Tax=Halomonas sp. B23F22_3 TaxID=3459516 RepID=UPI00373DFEC0
MREESALQSSIDDALAGTPPGRCVWIALSGGLDSSLLLTLAVDACRRHPRPLRALHVHHGLQAAGNDFARHCRRLASHLGVPLWVERVDVDRSAGQGVEGAAREARYAAFARRLAPGETLWLAQHADDQAETLLLAALRGSGVRGLAGMPSSRDGRGWRLARPLLGASRAALEAEAKRLGLAWVEDPSNADERLDRNFLRHRVLPLLETRWPAATPRLARSAALAGEADDLLDELAALDLARLGGDPALLPVVELQALSAPRQRLLIRYACQRLGLSTPPARRLESLLDQLEARVDGEVRVAWPGVEARVWRGHLYLLRPVEEGPSDDGRGGGWLEWPVAWDGQAPLATPWGVWNVTLRRDDGAAVSLRVAPRGGGERLRLAGRGRRDLKRLLQELEVPPWERGRLLVVHHGEEAVAVLAPSGRWRLAAEGWSAA